MSRMTCLIIFSGSSARSIISLRLARIKVLTRSKSPMVMLLSNFFLSDENQFLGPTAVGKAAPFGGCGGGRSAEILRGARGTLLTLTISFCGCGVGCGDGIEDVPPGRKPGYVCFRYGTTGVVP